MSYNNHLLYTFVGDQAPGQVTGQGDFGYYFVLNASGNEIPYLPPTITSFTPTSGAVGTVVTINGTNLAGTTKAQLQRQGCRNHHPYGDQGHDQGARRGDHRQDHRDCDRWNNWDERACLHGDLTILSTNVPTRTGVSEGEVAVVHLPRGPTWIENCALVAIKPSQVQAWVRSVQDVLAPSTVALVYGFVATILKSAVTDRLIARTSCQGIKLPKVPRRLVVPLPTGQVLALIDALPGRYRALALVGRLLDSDMGRRSVCRCRP